MDEKIRQILPDEEILKKALRIAGISFKNHPRLNEAVWPPIVSPDGSAAFFQKKDPSSPYGTDNVLILVHEEEGLVRRLATPQPCFSAGWCANGGFAVFQSQILTNLGWLISERGELFENFLVPDPVFEARVSRDGECLALQSRADTRKLFLYHRGERGLEEVRFPEAVALPAPHFQKILVLAIPGSNAFFLYHLASRTIRKVGLPAPFALSVSWREEILARNLDNGKTLWKFNRDGDLMAERNVSEPVSQPWADLFAGRIVCRSQTNRRVFLLFDDRLELQEMRQFPENVLDPVLLRESDCVVFLAEAEPRTRFWRFSASHP